MNFNSFQYALFLPAVFVVYWRLRHRGQLLLLLAASYFFYAQWDWRFLGLMMISTVTDYVVGRLLHATEDERRRRRLFGVSLLVNLGILGFFKYFNFFVDSAVRMLERRGLEATGPTLRILLPVGISFYTFHGISYTVDVYRRHIEPADNLLTFAVFVAYFPQLVAGPIGRAQLQLPQFSEERSYPDAEKRLSALLLIALGLFKKVVIADAVAPIVAGAFSKPNSAGALHLLLGAYAFAIQIYGDFSGYTDIARGSSRLLGIELIENFRQPYLSRNITEFWRNWHISLSTWLRDYLYIPLGGNRRGRLLTYRNLMLTMLLGGLWHGAAFTFVVWGGLHGAFLVGHRLMAERRRHEERESINWREDALRIVATFHLVCLAWIVFRADSLTEAWSYVTGILTLRPGPLPASALAVLGPMLLVFLIDVAQRAHRDDVWFRTWQPVPQGVVLGMFALGIIVFSGDVVPFIYFQF